MVKLPEPWGCMDQRGRLLADDDPAGAGLYTEAKLKQYGRDLLEEALNLVNTNNFYETVEKLRALIKEITE